MPELPEIEVLRRSLERPLVGDRVDRVEVRSPALREPVDRRRLARDVAGRQVEGLRRRAKYLLIDLEGARTLILHLGMSGRLTLAAGSAPTEEHEHLVFRLASGRKLRFRDPRRFGLVFSSPTGRLAADRHFARLGVEPVGPGSEAFSGAYLRRVAGGRRGPVKTFLMDSKVVVGVGNIYASEALHQAGIHPLRSVARIAPARWDRLAAAVGAVLESAITQGGTTLNDFADGEGNPGEFQVSLAVYGREGEPCPRCGAAVRRTVLAGRGTFHCPHCQR